MPSRSACSKRNPARVVGNHGDSGLNQAALAAQVGGKASWIASTRHARAARHQRFETAARLPAQGFTVTSIQTERIEAMPVMQAQNLFQRSA